MLLSMTGFGKAIVQEGTKKFTVEIKSLNSKQLDMASRVPSAYREYELDLRNIVSSRLERGKVDFTVYMENLGVDTSATINVDRLEAYRSQISESASKLGIPEPADWFSILMRMPEVIRTEAPAPATEDEVKAIRSAVNEAVDALIEFRRKEGQKLEAFFEERISRITDLLVQVPRYETDRIAKIRLRIEEALTRIPQVEYDKGRLEQEMIFYIEKLDINEEKQRLAQHLSYFLETMAAKPGQGKKLGFIAQEMGREINTLGSKSNQADMQILVVKMKDELEQIKEQVLNVM